MSNSTNSLNLTIIYIIIYDFIFSDLQSMMVCVNTNTTSCDPEDSQVKIVLKSLDEVRESAADRCPFLSDDMCSKVKECPVTSAGCEGKLEQGLVNREKNLCQYVQI